MSPRGSLLPTPTLSPEAPAPEPDAEPPALESRQLGWSLGAEAALDSGALPELAPGVDVLIESGLLLDGIEGQLDRILRQWASGDAPGKRKRPVEPVDAQPVGPG